MFDGLLSSEGASATFRQNVVVHEIGHNWFPGGGDDRDEHIGEASWRTGQACIMDNKRETAAVSFELDTPTFSAEDMSSLRKRKPNAR